MVISLCGRRRHWGTRGIHGPPKIHVTAQRRTGFTRVTELNARTRSIKGMAVSMGAARIGIRATTCGPRPMSTARTSATELRKARLDRPGVSCDRDPAEWLQEDR